MKKVYDVIEAIENGVQRYIDQTNVAPSRLTVSPNLYRCLMEIYSQREEFGGLVIGRLALHEVETSLGALRIIIDEVLPDTAIEIA